MNTAADWIGDRIGRCVVRVRYPETDRMNVAYHAHYLVWFEIGRTELMRELGCDYGDLEKNDGVFFPLRTVSAHYRVSAHYDDQLEVRSRIARVGGASIDFEYRVERPADQMLIATGATGHAAVTGDGRPCRLPRWVRDCLSGKSD